MRPSKNPIPGWLASRIRLRVPPPGGSIGRVRALPPSTPVVYVLPGRSPTEHLLMKSLAVQQDLPPGEVTNLSPEESARWEGYAATPGTVFVPVLFAWGRTPPRVPPTWIDLLFGEVDRPGLFRLLLLFFRLRSAVVVRVGDPVPAAGLPSTTPRLRRAVARKLRKERKGITGPAIRSRKRVVRFLLKTPAIRRAISATAQREKKDPASVERRAAGILWETVADFNPRYLAFARRATRWLWNRMFSGLHVDLDGLDRLRPFLRDHPVVLTPCHKSHMDYLLLSLLFHENDLTPPHIAAGINLSFFPMGPVFRIAGAFFIRRSILGEALYSRLLSSYIRWLISKGFAMEFFIEGGRTRTGKLVVPKTGLLTLTVDAFLEGASDDLFVVPIAIAYDRVPEDEFYQAELSGKEKEKESFRTIWKSRRLITRSHGAAYIRFSEPVSLRSFFPDPRGEDSVKTRKAGTSLLARRIIRAIGSQTTVTSTSLLATTLLSRDMPARSVEELIPDLILLREQLRRANAPLAPDVEQIESEIRRVTRFFQSNGWVNNLDPLPGKRLLLDFYKNTILHYLLPTAVAASDGDRPLLIGILSNEFTLEENEPDEAFLERGERALREVSHENRRWMAALIRNYLSSYHLTATAWGDGTIGFPVSSEGLRRMLASGTVVKGRRYPEESFSAATIKNASKYFNARGWSKDPAALLEWRKRLESSLS